MPREHAIPLLILMALAWSSYPATMPSSSGGDYEPVISEVVEFLTGQRPPGEVDRILTTVLFTDIVASTRRAAAEGDQRWRFPSGRARPRPIRNELSHFRGKEIK